MPPKLVLVVAARNRGWILEGICRELETRFAGTSMWHDGEGPLPAADRYFFSHYSLFIEALRRGQVPPERSFIFFTHPSHPWYRWRRVARSLDRGAGVLSMSSVFATELVARGVASSRTHVVLPGADPQAFRRTSRSGSTVGFCSAYYPRKSPERLTGLVRALPHRRFRLLGRGWPESPGFAALTSLRNFEYVEATYDEYPEFYASLDVFVSPSRLEGGPMPLLEAMMADVVPVATRTGFAPDLIQHGRNGVLVNVEAQVPAVAQAVEAAFAIRADVRATVEHLTWDRFAQETLTVMGLT